MAKKKRKKSAGRRSRYHGKEISRINFASGRYICRGKFVRVGKSGKRAPRVFCSKDRFKGKGVSLAEKLGISIGRGTSRKNPSLRKQTSAYKGFRRNKKAVASRANYIGASAYGGGGGARFTASEMKEIRSKGRGWGNELRAAFSKRKK